MRAKIKSQVEHNYFDRYVEVLEDIDAALVADEEKNKKKTTMSSGMSRYDKHQLIKQSKTLKTKDAQGVAALKCEKVQA